MKKKYTKLNHEIFTPNFYTPYSERITRKTKNFTPNQKHFTRNIKVFTQNYKYFTPN